MPVLRVTSGPHAGQQIALSPGSLEIGRDPACGISLAADSGVSRQHATLEITDQRVILHDLSSRNGVFVNGGRTISTILKPGDVIQIGNSTLELVSEQPAPPTFQAPVMPAGQAAFNAGQPGTTPAMTPAALPFPGSGSNWQAPAAPDVPASAYGPYNAPHPGFVGSANSGAQPLPYVAPAPSASSSVPYARWLYFLGFSIGPLALPLAAVFLRKDTPQERRVGWWLVAWSLVGTLLLWMSYVEIKRWTPLIELALGGAGALPDVKSLTGGG